MLNIHFNDKSGKPYSLVEMGGHDAHEAFLHQIAGKDRVHHFGAMSIDELREYRIGGPLYSKTAYAVVAPDYTVESVIFGYKKVGSITCASDMPGDVDFILHEKAATPLQGEAGLITFYSISAFVSGGGPRLVNALMDNCPAGVKPITLSPLRTMREEYPAYALTPLTPDEKTVMAFMHLMACKNPVQQFHMGNGAKIGALHTNANTADSIDGRDGYGVMANYFYTTDALARLQNRMLFGQIVRGEAARTSLVRLIEPELVVRVARLMDEGVMEHLYDRRMNAFMQRVSRQIQAARPRV